MNYNFYIIDDDKSIISILSKIIVNRNLGDVIGKASDGEDAMREIPKLKPDIVLVDLLLPNVDGISLVSILKSQMPDTPFIMISEVYSKEMVSKAYDSGVEFFINKPINVIEVVNILKRVDEKLKMKRIISSFHSAFQDIKSIDTFSADQSSANNTPDISETAKDIIRELGILSETGSKDILNIVEFVFENSLKNSPDISQYKLSDFYAYLSSKYEKEYGDNVNEKTIEQRIRRAVGQALENIAEFGLDDYSHLAFEKYASTLFEFKEVRKEMEFIRRTSKNRGKINIKIFLVGIVNEIHKNHQY